MTASDANWFIRGIVARWLPRAYAKEPKAAPGRLVPHLTYANIMATIAVFISLGGPSYAAIKLPKNSVGSKQLKAEHTTGSRVDVGASLMGKIK